MHFCELNKQIRRRNLLQKLDFRSPNHFGPALGLFPEECSRLLRGAAPAVMLLPSSRRLLLVENLVDGAVESGDHQACEAGSRSRLSPHRDRAREGKRHERKTEIDPGPISLGILGKHEEMGDDPDAGDKAQGHPDQVSRGIEQGPHGLALRSSHPHRDDKQGTYEDGAKDNGCRAQSERHVISPQRGVREALHELHARCWWSSPGLIDILEAITYGFQQYKPGVRASVVLFN